MSLHVLEFNDVGLRLSNGDGLVLNSPGYANIRAKEIEFGENAHRQSKLNPLSSFNQFWHKLSLDPFAKPIGHFRHNADIAFSHLQDIANNAELKGDIVLALPSSFSREQMAILLGLMKQSPMRPVGIVDAALLASIDNAPSKSVIHIDLHLHQVVLSKLQYVGNALKREDVILVPGAGWVNISDNLMQLFTSAFIQQCRFNPQHNAQSEQLLLDSLPLWLAEEQENILTDDVDAQEKRRSLEFKLNHNNMVHQASLPRTSLHSRLQPFYHKIQQQLAQLDVDGKSELLVSDRLRHLPGFNTAFSLAADGSSRRITQLDGHAVSNACLRYQEQIVGVPEALHFVNQLSPGRASVQHAPVASSANHLSPTHVLVKHLARSLGDGVLICVASDTQDLLQFIPQARREDMNGMTIVGEIIRDATGFILDNNTQVQLNGKTAIDRRPLHVGDRLSIAGMNQSIELIHVQEGHV